MKRLEIGQMERIEGGTSKDTDCAIEAAGLVLGGALGLLAVAASGGAALAFAGWGLGYVAKLYSVSKTCNII